MTLRVAAVVPVIEERCAIGAVVRGLSRSGACCVLVVDGGSRDDTRAVAADAGAQIVAEPRRGYGRACLTGAERALAPGSDGHVHDAVAFLDGDGSCDPDDLPALMAAAAHADVVLGERSGDRIERGAMPLHARLGNGLVAAVTAARCGRLVHDMPPFKLVRRDALVRLGLDDEGYGWTVQLVARAVAEPSLRVREVPVVFRVRQGGVSKVSGSWTASIRAGRAMIAVALRETRSPPVVALMAKTPGPGHAKTRLASELGEERTAELWAACLADVAGVSLQAARVTGARPIVMLAREADVEPAGRIIGREWTPFVQHRPGLAAALAEAFMAAFDGGADRAVAIAGDAAALPPARIEAALGLLVRDRRSAVIGPTTDGGYHLVGLRWTAVPAWFPASVRRRVRARLARRVLAVFTPVPMGGSSALESTVRQLQAKGWRVTTTPVWPDVDTLVDLRPLARDLERDDRWAPRTAAWLARHQTVIDALHAPADALHP